MRVPKFLRCRQRVRSLQAGAKVTRRERKGGARAEGMPQGTGWVRRWPLQPTLEAEAEQLKAPRRAAAVEGEGQVSVQAVGRSGSGGGSAGERESGGRG